jgi:hypothetical protein
MNIETVKIQQNGYLLNGTMSVPMADGNIEYELIKQWLLDGNIPEPEFTEEELAQQEQDKINSEARTALESGDWLVIRELERQFLAGTDLNTERESLRSKVV